MALALKVIGAGTLANTDQPLMSLATVGTGKAMIVKSIRLTNTTAGAVIATVKFNRPSTSPATVATAFKQSISANSSVVDTGELVLENGDSLSGSAASGSAIDYVISGIERDV